MAQSASEDNSEDHNEITRSGRGQFFAIDRRCFAKACDLGINPAVAYLVLACFTGGDNRTTKAGTQAVEKYAGAARSRAKAAIQALEAARLVTPPEGIKRKIATWDDLRGYAAEGLTDTERAIYASAITESEIEIKPNARGHLAAATSLVSKGLLVMRGNRAFRIPPESADDLRAEAVWLPNAIVTGAASETPPVALLRQSGDAMTVRLFADLYHAQNLAENGGVHWRAIRKEYKRIRVGQQGPFVVWGFAPDTLSAWPKPLAAPHLSGAHSEEERRKAWDKFWDRWGALTGTGLVEIVGHLVEGDRQDAEMIHPFAIQPTSDPLEHELARAAHLAAMKMVPAKRYEKAKTELGVSDLWAAPVPAHVGDVQLFGLARLRYRPRTKLTGAWYAEHQRLCREQIEQYHALAGEADAAAA